MDSIPDILEDLRSGQMIVLVDDEQRENEGDLVCAAEFASPKTINFMLRQGRGMMCVALEGAICDRLGLEPQGRMNTSLGGTAYTVTVDAHPRFGITTGVSAADRAQTIRLLADEQTRVEDLVRPGHMQPLRARDGGALVRAGQTEGSVDLCRLAGLRAAAVIIEIMNEDGTMARRPELERLCQRHGLKMCSVADVVGYRLQREKLVRRLASRTLETEEGTFELIAYQSLVDARPHLALVRGRVGELDRRGEPVECEEPVLVRMHRENLLGDVFGGTEEGSGRTLREAMRMIREAECGAVVYLRQEASQEALMPTGGSALEPAPSATQTGAYGIGCQILRDLGIRKIRLITNHPFQPTALSGFGLSIEEFVGVGEGASGESKPPH